MVAGTGTATGLDRGAWDCVMMRHVLAHAGPETDQIVAHLASRLAPGGHLYLVDTDTEAFRVTPADAGMDEQLDRYARFHRHLGNDTRVGSRLEALVRAAGLDVVCTRAISDRFDTTMVRDGWPLRAVQDAMLAAGQLRPDELPELAAAGARFADRPDSAVWVPMYLAVGRRP